MTSKTKKLLFLRFSIGALLIAGLFFVVRYLDSTYSNEQRALKPSEIDFTKSNQIQEQAQALAQEPVSGTGLPYEGDDIVTVPAQLSPAEQTLWRTFESLIRSKNDNDPRANDLKNLSADFRKALVERYSALQMEDRNGRGFVVFLISKDLKSAADLDFLQKVYQEAPCLSLENCATTSRDDNPHNAGVDQVTTNYPQYVALYQIEKQLGEKPELLNDPAMRAGILATLKQAEAFPVPAIHNYATKIRQKYNL